MPEIADLISAPDWIPHSLDAANGRLAFARIPPEQREALTFLADFKPDSDADLQWHSLADAVSQAPSGQSVHFLFHSAFCRSTLLVQALDALPGVSGLSEPMVLNHLQGVSMQSASPAIGPLCQWLGRSADSTVLKPSNFANGIIPAMLDQNWGAKGVVLYGELGDFLRSVAKKGLAGRIWGRKQLAHCRAIMPLELGLDEKGYFELSDLQCAAVAWLMQMRQFTDLLQKRPEQLRSLASNHFIAHKAETILACANWLGLEVSADDATAVAEGPLFASHAKLGGDYAAVQAEQSKAAESAVVEEEIAQIEQWIGVIMQQLRIALPLPAPLEVAVR
jgi:hypothetical protein